MTLLERTYTQLRKMGLTANAETFSIDYLGKNKNWFACQKHAQRDFSVSSALQCLRVIRSNQVTSALSKAQRAALKSAEQALLAQLNEIHCIADVF